MSLFTNSFFESSVVTDTCFQVEELIYSSFLTKFLGCNKKSKVRVTFYSHGISLEELVELIEKYSDFRYVVFEDIKREGKYLIVSEVDPELILNLKQVEETVFEFSSKCKFIDYTLKQHLEDLFTNVISNFFTGLNEKTRLEDETESFKEEAILLREEITCISEEMKEIDVENASFCEEKQAIELSIHALKKKLKCTLLETKELIYAGNEAGRNYLMLENEVIALRDYYKNLVNKIKSHSTEVNSVKE